MAVFTVACITCHEQDVVAAEATAEPGAAATVDNAAETETLLTEAEPAEGSDEGAAEDTDFVELLQGLILGLGFGATGAAIFVSRGNRRVSE